MTNIEPEIERALRVAIAAALDADPASAVYGLPVQCSLLPPENAVDREGLRVAPDGRKATVPGVWIMCRPYVPEGGGGMSYDDSSIWPAGRCSVDIRARCIPHDDPDASLIQALWGAIRSVVYYGGYICTNGVAVSGRVITAGDGGEDQYGQFLSVTTEIAVSIDQ